MISYRDVILGQPVNWASALNRGLVAWWLVLPSWSFGTNWRDLCGKNHGTLVNGPKWHHGPPAALQFDVGTGPKITGGWPATGATYTITAAIKPTGNTGWGPIYTNKYGSAGLTVLNNILRLYPALPAISLLDGAWQHVAAVSDSGTVTLYRNAVPLASASGAPSYTPSRMGANDIGEDFTGLLNDVRFYSRALANDEVAALYWDALGGHRATLRRAGDQAPLYAPSSGAATKHFYRQMMGAA